ncbi:MAG: methyltransferase domain-containing protein [Dehalococcoidia bacterium]
MTTQQIDEAKLMEFVGQAVSDMGAVLLGNLVAIGDKLGLYRGLAGAAPMTPGELAQKTGTAERYIREWLNAQSAGGYVTYTGDGRYTLSPEQTEALTNEESPAFVLGGFQGMTAATMARPRLIEAFKSGKGVGWDEHDPDLFQGTERFFRPGYAANLVAAWLPALDGVVPKLEAGASVADVGCGHGASTIIMARAYPKSKFTGFDYHAPSIEAARKAAKDAGVTNCDFQVASAKDYPGSYDLVCHFDCLHDMGDPAGAAAYTLKSLKPGGTWMLVEPFANDDVADNLNLVGKVFYSASTFICTPASLAQEVGTALGAQAGEKRLGEVARQAGFTRFRRAAETPFNLILEARA